MTSVQRIYSGLDFDSFHIDSGSTYPKKLEEECRSLRSYEKNQYHPDLLDDTLIARIQKRWSHQFARFGYSNTFSRGIK